MKKVFSIFCLLLITALLLTSFTSCGGCGFFGYHEEDFNTYFDDLERGTSVEVSELYVILDPEFDPESKENGYVSTADVGINIRGYDSEFTYFDAKVTVTWEYNEITEANPTGVTKTYTADVVLTADGDATYETQLFFSACRDVKLTNVYYSNWQGTATKK